MGWYPFGEGRSIGTEGSEGGSILQDEEHPLGARITLERNASFAPFAVTCGIYGWMFHTRFINTQAEAESDYERMKQELAGILTSIPSRTDPELDEKTAQVSDRISQFASEYP